MKHMKKAVMLAAVCCMALSGCGKNKGGDEGLSTEKIEGEILSGTESTELEKPVGDGSTRNPLTGEAMAAELASQRPVSVMVGNTTDAMPQYGTSDADIIYEVPVEGGLTRLMTLYQDYADLPTIMSVRSCRHYFAYFSEEFHAIYVHYGQAVYATEMLNNVDDLNGLDGSLADVTYFRDSSRKQPHNAYVNGKSIVAGIQQKGYETQLPEGFTSRYTFAGDNAPVDLANGVDAAVVAPGYLINKPWFVYHADDGLYYRNQYKSAHVDGANNEQLKFKNIIIQVSEYAVEPDGTYLDVNTTFGGAGKYITNGKAIDITWSKEKDTDPAKYYDADGNEIVLNQGKTYVCVVLNDATDRIGIYGSEEEYKNATE